MRYEATAVYNKNACTALLWFLRSIMWLSSWLHWSKELGNKYCFECALIYYLCCSKRHLPSLIGLVQKRWTRKKFVEKWFWYQIFHRLTYPKSSEILFGENFLCSFNIGTYIRSSPYYMTFLTNIWGLLNTSTLSFRSLFSSLEKVIEWCTFHLYGIVKI